MLPYNPRLKQRARDLRTSATDCERLLWSRVRRKQLGGVQFYRQKPLGNYIVDFYAPSARLVVEVDGSQHFAPSQVDHDRRRTEYLERQGLRVLRFTDLEILQTLDVVLDVIFAALAAALKSPLPPFGKGGQEL